MKNRLLQSISAPLLVEQVSGKGRSPLFSNSAISSHLQELGYPQNSIDSMNKCQEDTSLKILGVCENHDKMFISTIRHWCNLRTCPFCSLKRRRRIRRQYFHFLKSLQQTQKEFLYFLTISPKNYSDLNFGLKDIRNNFSKFLRLKYIKDRIKGSIYVIEAKQKEDSWNIHIHAIVYGRFLENRLQGKCLDCGQHYIKKDNISKKYYCASRKCNSSNIVLNSVNSPVVDLWRSSSKQEVNIHISRMNNLRKSNIGDSSFVLNYMLKYISANKDDFVDERGMAEYIVATKKLKLISRTGEFFNHPDLRKKKPSCSKCGGDMFFITNVEMSCFKYYASKKIETRIERYRREACSSCLLNNTPPTYKGFNLDLSNF